MKRLLRAAPLSAALALSIGVAWAVPQGTPAPVAGPNVDIKGKSLAVTGGASAGGTLAVTGLATLLGNLVINGGTANTVWFGQNGVGLPGTAGEKISLYGGVGARANSDYSIGVNGNDLWLNAPSGGAVTAKLSGVTVASLGAVTTVASYAVASLPACDASTKNGLAIATDVSAAPTYRQTGLSGGGSVPVLVFCNGSAWEAH